MAVTVKGKGKERVQDLSWREAPVEKRRPVGVDADHFAQVGPGDRHDPVVGFHEAVPVRLELVGPHAGFKFWVPDDLTTALEMKLVAPEPIILEIKESTGDAAPHATGRVKLVGKGGSAAVAELKGAPFRHAYVLVRPE